jgi:chondroitin AC lyase
VRTILQRHPFWLSLSALLLTTGISEAQTTLPVLVQQVSSSNHKPDADMETIKKRIVDDLMEPSVNAKAIRTLIETIQPDGTWPGINYKDVSRTGFEHKIHLDNMLGMARAYKKQGSPLYKDAALKKAFSAALDFWLAHDFICDNWWWNEMGTPGLMINTLMIMDTDLTEKQRTEGLRIANRANLQASGARPGGDLIAIAGMLGKQALFTGNADTLQRVVNVMASQITLTEGRGLQYDLSFHHRVDNVISTLTYGTNYVSTFAYWAVKIAGTHYSLPDSATHMLIDYYLDGICKSSVYGKYPDPGGMNRDITRRNALDAESAALPENLRSVSSYRAKELDDIISIRKGKAVTVPAFDRFFWHSSYYTHQRQGYFMSVRMHSSRANNMEEPHNEEGVKNHHYGDGSTFISRTAKEYVDIFPVWDWQKIPGTTILQTPTFPHWKELAKKGLTDFSGAVKDGHYGAAAFDFISVHDPLKARKSWFFFDQQIVCLGTAISSDAPWPVITTLNQCLLNGKVIVQSTGGNTTLRPGKHPLSAVSWVYHDSVAYLFPLPADVTVNNTTATGTWRSVNHQAWATEDTVRKEVFTLTLDHGTQPHNAGYAYVVVPGIDAASIKGYTKKQPIRILSNTPDLQAVQHTGLNRTEIVFYKAGAITINPRITLEAASPCIVMIKTNITGNAIEEIAVTDPTQKLASIQLTTNVALQYTGKKGKATWNDSQKTSIIQIAFPKGGYAGDTVVMELQPTASR